MHVNNHFVYYNQTLMLWTIIISLFFSCLVVTVSGFTGSKLLGKKQFFFSSKINTVVLTRQQATNQQQGFNNVADYVSYLSKQAKLPQGFKVGSTRFNFSPLEVSGKILPMNVTLITLDEPTESFAAMFTSNKVPGGPVVVGKNRMKSAKYLQAVIVNNKISNVSPSNVTDRGAGDSERLCAGLARQLGLPSNEYVFPSSTGIIGWRLPVDAIESNLAGAITALQSTSMLPAALGITTTDRYPKMRRYDSKSGKWSIVGIAKGAGMIEPNMATMLSYIVTDLAIPRQTLQAYLQTTVSATYNTISVDGDQSTSDTGIYTSLFIVLYG